MSVITYLDQSGKTRGVKVNNWRNELNKGNWGRYGWWCQFNLDEYWLTDSITDEALYAGNVDWGGWHIRWS